MNKKAPLEGPLESADLNRLAGDLSAGDASEHLKHVDQHKKLLLLNYLKDKLTQ